QSSESLSGQERPKTASLAPLCLASASAHSAAMPFPPPLTRTTSSLLRPQARPVPPDAPAPLLPSSSSVGMRRTPAESYTASVNPTVSATSAAIHSTDKGSSGGTDTTQQLIHGASRWRLRTNAAPKVLC